MFYFLNKEENFQGKLKKLNYIQPIVIQKLSFRFQSLKIKLILLSKKNHLFKVHTNLVIGLKDCGFDHTCLWN